LFALNGCSAQITETIEILDAPVAGISFVGDQLEYEVISFVDGSFGATEYIYDFDDGTGSQESDPQHIFTDAGQYLVTQTVSNSSGCSDESSVLVSILSEEILAPKLPNAFTPNGDGENDVFFVRGGPFATVHMEIYNGWGEMIFTSDDPLFGWDGTVDGKPEQVGTYIYTATATTIDGREFVKSGKVALIR
jgi:gliding motility-associated-like protein